MFRYVAGDAVLWKRNGDGEVTSYIGIDGIERSIAAWVAEQVGHVNVAADDIGEASANTSLIQAALDAAGDAGGGRVEVNVAGVVYINSTIYGRENCTLVIGPATELRLTGGTKLRMIEQAGYTPVTITSLTYSAGVVTAAATGHGLSVGQFVSVGWAGSEGYNGVFRVDSVADANTFTYLPDFTPVSSPAVVSASASTFNPGVMQCRRAMENFWVINKGVINQDSTVNTGSTANGLDLHALVLGHGVNCGYEGPGVIRDVSKYCVLYYAQRGWKASNFVFDSFSDGVHGTGPLYGCEIDNVSGYCEDNMVAAGTGDYAAYHVSEGDVHVVHKNLTANGNPVSPYRSIGASNYKIISTVDGIHGTTLNRPAAELLVDPLVLPNGNVRATDIRFKNIDAFCGTATMLGITPHSAEYIEIDGLKPGCTTAGQYMISIGNSSAYAYKTVVCRRIMNTEEVLYPNLHLIGTGSAVTVNHLIVDEPHMEHNQVSTGRVVELAGTVSRLTVIKPTTRLGSALVNILSTLAATCEITIDSPNCYDTNYIINNNSTRTIDATITGGMISLANTVFRHAAASGTMRCRESGVIFDSNTTPIGKTSTGVMEAYGWGLSVDPISTLATTVGQFCNSTNAGTNMAGKAVRTGAGWVALGTGTAGANTVIS